MTRPAMPLAPFKREPEIRFKQIDILGKKVWVSPNSKIVLAVKRAKKTPTAVKVYSYDQLNEAVLEYKKMQGIKKPKLLVNVPVYYFLIQTDELEFHECVVHQTSKFDN